MTVAANSTWYRQKQWVKEDKRKNNPGRPVPGYTINPDGSIIPDELIVSALEHYRNQKENEGKPQELKKCKQTDHKTSFHQMWELDLKYGFIHGSLNKTTPIEIFESFKKGEQLNISAIKV